MPLMWSAKVSVKDYAPFDMLPELDAWVINGFGDSSSYPWDWKQRAVFAVAAQEALSYAYDTYRDVVRPIRVGVDPATGHVFVIRESAKNGCYVAAPSEIRFNV